MRLYRPLFRRLYRPLFRRLLGGAGGSTPVEPIVITAPDGAYAGQPLVATGGCPVVWDLDVESEYEGFEDGDIIYRIYVNGDYTGIFFFGEEGVGGSIPFPLTVGEGDVIEVQDYCGNVSNSLVATWEPDAAIFFEKVAIADDRMRAVNHWTAGLKQLGLWDDILGMWPMRSGDNAGSGSTIYALKGPDAELSGGTIWGGFGVTFPSMVGGLISYDGITIPSNSAALWVDVDGAFSGNFTNPALMAHGGYNANQRGWQILVENMVMFRGNGTPRAEAYGTYGDGITICQVINSGATLSDYGTYWNDTLSPTPVGTPNWASLATTDMPWAAGPSTHGTNVVFKMKILWNRDIFPNRVDIRNLYNASINPP